MPRTAETMTALLQDCQQTFASFVQQNSARQLSTFQWRTVRDRVSLRSNTQFTMVLVNCATRRDSTRESVIKPQLPVVNSDEVARQTLPSPGKL
jgi:hypothetical protein